MRKPIDCGCKTENKIPNADNRRSIITERDRQGRVFRVAKSGRRLIAALLFGGKNFEDFLRQLFLRAVEFVIEFEKFQLLLRRKGRGIQTQQDIGRYSERLCKFGSMTRGKI